MLVIRLHTKCIFFLASLTLSYCRHISFDVEDMKRILSRKESCDGVCMTPECVKTAARIISSLDESVDPCSNFYRFACGGWLSSHVIPKGKELVSVDSTIADDINMKLNALIEKKLDGTEPAFVKMLKDVYDACMDLETIDKIGSEPLKKDLVSLGGWPVVEGSNWNESSFDWLDSLIAFRRLGYDHNMLIHLYVHVDALNNKINNIRLDPALLDLYDWDHFILGLNDSETAARYNMGVKEAVLLGADENIAEEELLDALQFYIELVKISMAEEGDKDKKDGDEDKTDEDEDKIDVDKLEKKRTTAELKDTRKRRERRDVSKTSSRYTVAELQDMIPQISWLKYLNGLLNVEIGETENIVVDNPIFLKKLVDLLEKTEKRVVANYMFWRIVHTGMSYVLRMEELNLEEKPKGESRHEQCFDMVKHGFHIAFNAYFVRHYFKEDRKNAVMELVKYIHREFLRILEDADWMDDATKKEAIEKANSMKLYIGYPKELLNDTVIMEIYENLTISNNSFYRNVMNFRKWETDFHFSALKKTNIKAKWLSHAEETPAVNAFYVLEENSVDIPAGQLLNDYFEKDRPHYMNFGATGYVIGHEITHGFDVSGKEYDKDGNKVDWWDKTTEELYHKRVQCMVDQYSNYTVENGMKINGDFTKDDDIADNGGLKAAYRAYHSWVKRNGPEPLLPAIKYNQDQLFWISFAQTYCEKKTLERLSRDLLYDPHSPNEHRVIGSMSNLPEFSRDFNCPSDSPMNRENKCHVW